MEERNQYDELILKYLENETNAQEEAVIKQWLESGDENRQYFEDVRKLLNLVTVEQTTNKIDVEEEWKQFEGSVGLKQLNSALVSTANTEESIDETRDKGGVIRKIVVSIAVAASLILLVGLGSMFITNKKEKPLLAHSKNVLLNEKEPAIAKNEINNTEKPKTFKLSDGSVVVLWPGSIISFHEPFVDNRRDIKLTGKADFKVSKDKTRPFTVFSDDISTTAIGTHFTVSAYGSAPNITVKLDEGKVVVKSVPTSTKRLEEDVYLLPGQQVIYNKQYATTKVSSTKKLNNSSLNRSDEKEAGATSNDVVISGTDKAPWYMFNNQSLPAVFEQLKEMYHVDIIYSKPQVAKMYFIGRFNKSDSIESILEQIGRLNNLKVQRQNGKFRVTR